MKDKGTGNHFFYNEANGESVWVRPVAAATAGAKGSVRLGAAEVEVLDTTASEEAKVLERVLRSKESWSSDSALRT